MGNYSVVAQDGKMYGPVTEAGIVDWIRQGRVIRDTVLYCHDTNSRTAAWTLPALQEPLGLSQQEVNQLLHPQPQLATVLPVNYASPQLCGGPAVAQISDFPVAAAVLLSIFVPLFPLIYYGVMHGSLPKRRPDDPGAGKAIGFMFIPFFNIYWMCFFWIRLCTRLNDERSLAGLAPTAPRGLVVAICWCHLGLIIPLVNFLAFFAIAIMGIIAVAQIQTGANELANAIRRA